MLTIGLTGGIGSGKSTVAAMLAERGAVVVDADAIAREVVEPGTPTLAALVERFGESILAEDGSLDRKALAAVAFASEESKADLEAITHPAIGAEFVRRLAEAPADAVVVHDVPLLVESARGLEYAGVIVVEAPREVRLARLEARGIDRADAEARMGAQASDEERRAVATWLIDNSGDLDALERRVDEIWREIERMRAHEDRPGDESAAQGRPRPRGPLRWLLRAPTWIYRAHLGRLLGGRFLLLVHRGRRTGHLHRTVLEVVRHDPDTGEYVVASGWGPGADWYRNLRAAPPVAVQVGGRRWAASCRFLDDEEAAAVFADYERRHPRAAARLGRLLGYEHDGTDESWRRLAARMPMVAFSRPPHAS